MKQIANFLLIGLVLLGIVVVYDGFFIVEEGKQVVITQFGRPIGTPKTEAGIYFKMPFVQQVNEFDKRIVIWNGEPNQIPTNDKTFVFLDVTARWRITDALTFLQAVKTVDRAQSLLNDIIGGTVRDMVNKNNLIEIIRSSDWSIENMSPSNQEPGTTPERGRDVISDQALEIAARATPQYGIELLDVVFKRVNYIDTVRESVYNRMISERKRIAAEKRSTGEGQKARILGTVDRELREITSGANREAMLIKGEADAEATRIYGESYNQDPEFFAFMKTLESYESVIGDNTSLVLSSDSDLFHYLKNSSRN
ncbi:protease modulator HflC [Desulfofustis glycolicus]|uniref:Protein HflC n=1 Tax=Desulfofustis glycolicus DSM 9705 TaxID=1121409 RepID=A0A1M5W295_9BACT|nr:protease modulator HflC [Desulfofustis glycolicus]MCB2215091.1 protease modulator HflC [Desulfobulbaceae bacterium]SHH81615.1 protease FtsH subunit HflC [Desulfofustis glycolicus DSM 9705]